MKKYSKEQFEDYKFRVKVLIKYEEDGDDLSWEHEIQMDIYTDDEDMDSVRSFLLSKAADKVTSIEIIHTATKEQDEMAAKFIEETLKDI